MMSKNNVTVSCIQLSPRGADQTAMMARAEELFVQAADAGSQLVILPECWTGNGLGHEEACQKLADTIPGKITAWLSEKAQRYSFTIIGSFYQKLPELNKCLNTMPVILPTGEILTSYSKTHLFDAPARKDLTRSFSESSRIKAGDELVVAHTEITPIGLSICMDLRFPELYRKLVQLGAKVLVNSAAWLAPRHDHWETLLKARAIENQCYMIACGCYGVDTCSGVEFVGRSCIISPWGEVLAMAEDKECIVTVTIDLAVVDDLREQFPVLSMRRPELYQPVVLSGTPPLLSID